MVWEILIGVIIFSYVFALLWVTTFSLGQLNLAWNYLKIIPKKETLAKHPIEYPAITVQLPVYNEKYVIRRLIRAVADLDYPLDKLTIQILDNSSDETTTIIQEELSVAAKHSFTLHHIRRSDRAGFKAGALAYGLKETNDPFIAIFDADFVPPRDFLKRMIQKFDRSEIGMVQGRWAHLNENYSLLTGLQAFGLDAHFTVEQSGRNHTGSFMNFNGTAGIWRRACIIEAGGWTDDTLTEDLDLSYRAQLAGWKFVFAEDILCPGELPVMVPAIKSQQYRWNKGAAEAARKHLRNILMAPIHWKQKLRASMHLLNSSVFLFILIAALLSLPMLMIKHMRPEYGWIFDLGTIFVIGFVAIGIFYWISTQNKQLPQSRLKYFAKKFPLFMIFSMGLALHNAIAITEGFFGKKTPFIRTPKFNLEGCKESWEQNKYIGHFSKVKFSDFIELILALYFLFGMGYGIYIGDYGLLLWHLMLSLGFGVVSILSFKAYRYASSS